METKCCRKNNKSAYVIILLIGLFLGLAIPMAYGGKQPHMENALRHLHAAKFELERATPNKGGHRERAIHLAERAIYEVREGINFANTH